MIADTGRIALSFFVLYSIPLLFASDAEVKIDWLSSVRVLSTQPTLQVVVNPMLRRHVPQSKAAFESLSLLGANIVRFVPWLPYPRLAVAALEPPSGHVSSIFFKLESHICNAIRSCFAAFDLPMMAKYRLTLGAPKALFPRLILSVMVNHRAIAAN
jgi:hypothetical protein